MFMFLGVTKTDENNVCMHVLHTIIDSIQVEAELAYAHILSLRRVKLVCWASLNKKRRTLTGEWKKMRSVLFQSKAFWLEYLLDEVHFPLLFSIQNFIEAFYINTHTGHFYLIIKKNLNTMHINNSSILRL